MKFSAAVFAGAVLSTGVLATPEPQSLNDKLGNVLEKVTCTKNLKGKCCKPKKPEFLIPFTSTYHIINTPEQVVNATGPTGGLPGSSAVFDLGINTELDLVCYYIETKGFGDAGYSSPATTATHIHEGAKGASGPPRIVFPDPISYSDENVRVSAGCVSGPFLTGLAPDGTDTGVGFTVAEIEADPAAFYTDIHTDNAVPGAVRGQFA